MTKIRHDDSNGHGSILGLFELLIMIVLGGSSQPPLQLFTFLFFFSGRQFVQN